MFTLLLFVSVSCISTVLASAPLAGYCDGPTSDNCYLIYEQDNNNKSWDQADEACRKLNQRLATVPDENIQEIMKMLAGVGDGEAWVSGKGVIGPWKDITSKQLVNGAMTDSEDPNKRCVVLQTDTSSLVKTQIIAVGCKPETGRMVVCQYPQTATNECLIGSKLSSTCFMVYKDTFLTLDDGQQFCQNISSTVTKSSTPPFLAYIDVDDSSFINFVFYNFKNKRPLNPEDNQFWLGIQRDFEWTWKTDTTDIPVNYTSWAASEPRTNGSEKCISLDLTADSSWISSSCEDTKKYYICTGNRDDIPTTTTPETTTSVTTTVTTTSETTNAETTEPKTPSASSNTNGVNLVLIIVFSIGGFLFIVGIMIAVYISRMDGKDEQSDQYDGGEGQSTEFGIYSQPHGVRRFMDSVKRLGSMNKRQAVVKKGKRNTGHEQVQDIFISPTLPRESKPDGSEANDDHPPEVFGYPAGSRRPTVDDRKTDSLAVNDVSTNPIYSVNRSQFTGSSVTYQNIDAFPTSRPIQSTTLPVSPSSDIAPPIPPKSLTLLRRSDNTRNNYPSFDDNVVPDIPPPPPPLPSTPSLGVSSRSPSPSILRSSGVGEARAISYGQGRIDLNRDNMMF